MNNDDEIPWQPPSESEMKIIQARRDRQDKISAITGEYLLKGYKMLSAICEICGTILLQNRQGVNYCVACSEVDTEEHMKDDPALSNEAAQKKAEEGHYISIDDDDDDLPRPSTSTQHISSLTFPTVKSEPVVSLASTSKPPVTSTIVNDELSEAIDVNLQACLDSSHVIKEKMIWATQQLKACQTLNRSIQLCSLLKSCAEALFALKQFENHCINVSNANQTGSVQHIRK